MTRPVPPSELDELDEFYDGLPCQFCDEGLVVVCPDDLCRANGGCVGLGRRMKEGCYGVCPHCKGEPHDR